MTAVHVLALTEAVSGWLDLGLRWLHVIAAMAWIGTSFYFVLLDQSLRPPKDAEDEASYGYSVEVMDKAREGGAITMAPAHSRFDFRVDSTVPTYCVVGSDTPVSR